MEEAGGWKVKDTGGLLGSEQRDTSSSEAAVGEAGRVWLGRGPRVRMPGIWELAPDGLNFLGELGRQGHSEPCAR